MYEYGKMMGVAFQIQDDWLDTFGDCATFGQSISAAISSTARRRILYVAALAEGGQTVDALRAAFKHPRRRDEDKGCGTRLYEKLGIDEKCKEGSGGIIPRIMLLFPPSLWEALKALNAASLIYGGINPVSVSATLDS